MHRITAAAIGGVFALALSGLAVAGPAAAVEPGDGAVIFNPDGTPIGSEIVYPSGDPQFVYTSETGDDDQWGLLADGNPEHNGTWTEGIPLGFTLNIDGMGYSSAIVTSNGAICLLPDTGTWDAIYDNCWTYDNSPGSFFSASFDSGTLGAYAAVLALANDQYPPNADTPVDTGGGPEPDACTFGAFLFFDGTDAYCSAVFWGTTTYEGKPAFAATWFHNPDYDATDEEETWFSTYQAIIVDDGGGNALIVLNYDEVNQTGADAEDLNDYGPPYQDACEAQVDAGDDATTSSSASAARTPTTRATRSSICSDQPVRAECSRRLIPPSRSEAARIWRRTASTRPCRGATSSAG